MDSDLRAADETAWRDLVKKETKRSVDELRRPFGGAMREPLYVTAPSAMPPKWLLPGGPWQIIQEYSDPRMQVSADAMAKDLRQGADGVWLSVGLDVGVRVLTTGDYDMLIRHVALDKTPVYLDAGADCLSVSAAHVAIAESRGCALDTLCGGYGADPIGTLLGEGQLAFGYRMARRQLTEVGRLAEKTPQMKAALVSTRSYAEAGVGAAEEVGIAVATALDYVRVLVDSGLPVERAADHVVFAVSVTSDLAQTVAKLRALRWVWLKVLLAAGVSAEVAGRVHVHARSARSHRTQWSPYANVLRGATEVLGGALGGASSIACLPFDAMNGPSDASARRLARNTQLVLREEAHVREADDLVHGAYAFESMTSEIARAAWLVMQSIEDRGGIAPAVREGFVKRQVDAAAEKILRDARAFALPFVGVTHFPDVSEEKMVRDPVRLEEVEVEIGTPFGDATAEIRHGRLLGLVKVLRKHGESPGELMEATLSAMRASVDMFSVRSLLQSGQASLCMEPLQSIVLAEPWESLRDQATELSKSRGRPPSVAVEQTYYGEASSWQADVFRAAGALVGKSEEECDIVLLLAQESDGDALRKAVARHRAAKRLVVLSYVDGAGATTTPFDVDEYLTKGEDAATPIGRLYKRLFTPPRETTSELKVSP